MSSLLLVLQILACSHDELTEMTRENIIYSSNSLCDISKELLKTYHASSVLADPGEGQTFPERAFKSLQSSVANGLAHESMRGR